MRSESLKARRAAESCTATSQRRQTESAGKAEFSPYATMLHCYALLCPVMSSRYLREAAGPPGFHSEISLIQFSPSCVGKCRRPINQKNCTGFQKPTTCISCQKKKSRNKWGSQWLLVWAAVCSPTHRFAVNFFYSTKISLEEMRSMNRIPYYSIIYDGDH